MLMIEMKEKSEREKKKTLMDSTVMINYFFNIALSRVSFAQSISNRNSIIIHYFAAVSVVIL
jgi:hypothetical protein